MAADRRFDDQHLQTFTSCLFLAGLLSSFPAAWVTSNRGRKTSMVISGVSCMRIHNCAACNCAFSPVGGISSLLVKIC
jgi:hypothetical protein